MIRLVRGSWRGLSIPLFLAAAAPLPVAAHSQGDLLPPLDPVSALTAWSIDPLLTLVLVLFGAGYLLAVRNVNRRHPASAVPAWRSAAWIGGLAVVGFALEGSVDVYADALFSIHMVQHLLLIAIAAPLFALAAPVTLVLRLVSAETRQRFVLPILHSRVVGFVGHPVVTWLIFAAVMWGSHFSPLFDWALENDLVHHFEHALYLGAAMLFWWPVVGADPMRHRLGWTARLVYLLTALPFNSFLGVAIYFAPNVLYPHYATVLRAWGPSPLFDQQVAGAVMWVGGDLAFLVALLLGIAGLLADEERKGRIYDARMDTAAERARLAGESRR